MVGPHGPYVILTTSSLYPPFSLYPLYLPLRSLQPAERRQSRSAEAERDGAEGRRRGGRQPERMIGGADRHRTEGRSGVVVLLGTA